MFIPVFLTQVQLKFSEKDPHKTAVTLYVVLVNASTVYREVCSSIKPTVKAGSQQKVTSESSGYRSNQI